MNDIILIDDEVTENSPAGEELKSIIISKGHSIQFINTKPEIDKLLSSNLSGDLKLVLLDLDLSKIRVDAKDILPKLINRGLKVIILSALPKIPGKRKERYQQALPCMNTLYAKGASSYILKDDMDKKEDFVGNILDRTIKDPNNSEYTLSLDCNLAKFEIKDKSNNCIIEKDLAGARSGWENSPTPRSAEELILRLLFEMGKIGKKEVRISNIYPDGAMLTKSSKESFDELCNELLGKWRYLTTSLSEKIRKFTKKDSVSKKEVEDLKKETEEESKKSNSQITCIENFIDWEFEYSAITPADFQKVLGQFNDSIRNRSNGLVVSRLLQGVGGHGSRGGIYKANIGKIELENYDNIFIPVSMETRLSTLEKRLEQIEKMLATLTTK